jgi:transcriptional regulator with XRE-family HTH domain
MTLDQLAERVGTSFQQIARLETGDRRLAEVWMRKIAPALGVRPADLLADTSPNNGEFVQRPDEISLLRWWRLLVINEKQMIADMARAKGLEIVPDKPKKRRA